MLDVETLGAALKLVKEGGGGGGEGAAIIDDSKILTSTTWSSQKIINTLCPPFTVSGATVQCTPVANYPLDVQVEITPTQEGTGDPSPENVRPIVGWDAVNIHQSNGDHDNTYTIQLGQTVYSGTFDVGTGTLTVTHKHFALPIAEMDNNENYPGLTDVAGLEECVTKDTDSYIPGAIVNCTSSLSANTNGTNKVIYRTKESWGMKQSELKAMYPDLVCEIVMPLLTPVFIQLTTRQIFALSGTNTLFADAGSVTVSGLSDPIATISSLQNRVSALESAALN